jgi:hypothetical protein
MIGIQRGDPLHPLTCTERYGVLNDLRRWSVRTVIVGPMAQQHEMIDFLKDVLAREPSYEGGVYVWWEVDAQLPPQPDCSVLADQPVRVLRLQVPEWRHPPWTQPIQGT